MDNPHRLYQRIQRASQRHEAEFTKYMNMLTSGFTSGRFYSQEELAEQLAKADAAQEAAQALQEQFNEAVSGDE